jgi:predicted AlkP superfamily pyrophosphatase or phosphodiesterase
MSGTHRRLRALLLPTLALALASCRATAQAPAAAPSNSTTRERPTLVVFITVDQLATDYLQRHGADLDGGLKRLMREGAYWARGVHDHAITETAPGHASTMSGRFPVSTGISSNSQGVNTTEAPLIGSDDLGASPFRFQGTTLYDWMKAANPAMRVLSVSRKDRGAILPIGRAPVDVYWYASQGIFTTSTYYRRDLPSWVNAFNARRGGHRLAGRLWETARAANRYAEPDTMPIESGGVDYTFPHAFPWDSSRAASLVRSTPWMDSLTLSFALEGVRTMQLGAAANRTDLLAVSLSSTDAVGHQWGPDSRELHDQIVRLDAWLGTFLDSLFALRDSRRIVIALTADHGVAPFAELKSPFYANHAAQRVDLARVMRYAKSRIAADGLDSSAIGYDDGFRVLKPEVFRAAGIDPDHYARMWVEELRRTNGVLRADMLTDLVRADTVADQIARRWLHMFDTTGPVRAVVTLTPFSYFTGVNYATHGSPHEYDARVPVLFWGKGIRGGARDGEARVVDMAPTLADWLGIRPLERLDGRVLPLAP